MKLKPKYLKVFSIVKNKLFFLVLITVVSLIIGSLFLAQKPSLAANTNWDMGTAGDYTYDPAKIEFSSGIAKLKAGGIPGTDWIATDGGSDWNFQKTIIIDNTGGTAQTDYQIKVTADTTGDNIQDDCDDLRFTSSDRITNLSYWIEPGTCNTSTTKIWVKIPSIAAPPSTTTIYMYYGNNSASAILNGTNTFIFFDDFNDGTIDTDKWLKAGIMSEAGGVATGSNSGSDYLFGKTRINIDTSTFIRMRDKATNNSARPGVLQANGNPYNVVGFGWQDYSDGFRYTDTFNSGINQQSWGQFTTNWYNLETAWQTGSVKFWVDGNLLVTHVTQIPVSTMVLYAQVEGNAEYDFIYTRKYVSIEPVASFFGTAYLYSNDSPSITPNTTQGYSSLSAFSQTLDSGSSGTIKYQISSNNGSSWYWYSGGNWITTGGGYSESNTASDINSNIADFSTIGSNPKAFKWRAYLNSNGAEQPKLDSLSITYVWDTAAPDNPESLTQAKSAEGGSDITSDQWSKYPSPYFAWNIPDDNHNSGETDSGIAGYYVYFNTDPTADPHTAGNWQTDNHFATPSLVSGNTYYLRIETKDNAGNINHIASGDSSLFIYKYDGNAPNSPLYVSVSPSGYTRTKLYTFSWPTSGGNAASDTGGSGLAGSQYKINGGNWSGTITGGSLELNDQASQGVNVFYFRAIDNAGNEDATPVQTNFYFNDSAPTCPTNLHVDPESNTTNSYTFTWDDPVGDAEIAGYYYSVNQLPTIANVLYTENKIVGPDAFATQQGENTFYIVSRDNAGNYDLGSCSSIAGNPTIDSCAKVIFMASTTSPGAPTTLSPVDGSNRDLQIYKVFLSWTAPTNQGTGFAGYEIYRSSDGTSFASVGTTSGTTYADTDLSSSLYYYYVKAKDNAGQYSAASSTVSITPTGRYTTAPVITNPPTSIAKSFSVKFSWNTDREASSFVYISPSQSDLNSAKATGDPSKTTDHMIDVGGLEPETIYYYKAMWEDVDGNQGTSDTYTFTTGLRPRILEVNINNIGLETATITWKSTTLSHASVNFGEASSYGGTIEELGGGFGESHIAGLSGLKDTATYHFQISGVDVDGNKIVSDDYTFNTLTRPKIENLRFEPVKDAPNTTLKFTWESNIPITSIVSYQFSGGTANSRSDAEYRKTHEIVVDSLQDKATYILIVKGVDEHGVEAVSDTNTYNTPEDTRPPKVTDLNIELKSSGIGSTQKAQVVVSWKTDENGTSQVEYGQGISGTDYSFKSKEDGTLTTNHAVIVSELDPSKIYHLRAISKDTSGNPGYSQDTTTITGKAQNSIIDIIINSLETSLGWLFRLGG